MNQVYIWVDGAVEELPEYISLDQNDAHGVELRYRYIGCPIYDIKPSDVHWRYGTLIVDTTRDYPVWAPVPKKDFPKEFLVELLLLGVPI